MCVLIWFGSIATEVEGERKCMENQAMLIDICNKLFDLNTQFIYNSMKRNKLSEWNIWGLQKPRKKIIMNIEI